MKTPPPTAFNDQPSAPSLNAFFEDQPDSAPTGAASSYDFFGNSELVLTRGDR